MAKPRSRRRPAAKKAPRTYTVQSSAGLVECELPADVEDVEDVEDDEDEPEPE